MVAVVYVVWAQPEKSSTNFDATVSCLDQKVTKKGYNMQYEHFAKTGSQQAKYKLGPVTLRLLEVPQGSVEFNVKGTAYAV